MQGDVNQMARTNLCPPISPPKGSSFHAFCYVAQATGAAPSFVASGAGETTKNAGAFPEGVIAYGDTGAAGMRRKAECVVGEIERRMALIGGSWQAATGVRLYAVHEIRHFVAGVLVARGAAGHGLTWHFARPPIVGLEYEIDVRAVNEARVIV
jgi:hypothetical protein